jgi:hypothetical protein
MTAMSVPMWAMMLCAVTYQGEAPSPAQRGEAALTGRAFIPPSWPAEAFGTLWRRWPGATDDPPRSYAPAVMDYYGLHAAPYANGNYPMGLRETTFLGRKRVGTDCMLCHAGSIFGQSYLGLPNASLDMQTLFDDMGAGGLWKIDVPLTFSKVRGTTETSALALFLLSLRDPDLNLHSPRYSLGQPDNLCEDAPAWWLLKKKKTMYYTGHTDARSVRSLMQFMLSPINLAGVIKHEESTFADIRAFLLTLQPPRYPFPVESGLALKGERVFHDNCARCHGTYGPDSTYPSRIVPIDEIDTDRTRFDALTEEAIGHYNQSWFAQDGSGPSGEGYPIQKTAGYQAPPLDGLWATAPYFHNGSVPTVYDVLKSPTRPKVYTRSFRTGHEDYDPARLGWKVQIFDRRPDPDQSPYERRKVYDTTQPGRGNGGHTFGDDLTEDERTQVIEYLKTL